MCTLPTLYLNFTLVSEHQRWTLGWRFHGTSLPLPRVTALNKKNPLSLLFTNNVNCVIGTSRLVASLACLGCKALNQLVEKVLAESPETWKVVKPGRTGLVSAFPVANWESEDARRTKASFSGLYPLGDKWIKAQNDQAHCIGRNKRSDKVKHLSMNSVWRCRYW